MSWTQVCYEYDGTFEGLLTCVFESYAHHEEPVYFLSPEDTACTLWPARLVETDPEKAGRVLRSIGPSMGGDAVKLVCRAFLTCLEEKELHIYRFLRYGYRRGRAVMYDLGDNRVDVLRKAVYHLEHEAHQFTGFVRFSDQRGVLISEIEPKNQVLPLLQSHFVQRFNTERFIIYDRTHKEALVYQPRQWAIVPLEDFSPGRPGEEELAYRRLWRRFFNTIAIEGRINPRCQNTNLPKRYRGMMTEFQPEDTAALPYP